MAGHFGFQMAAYNTASSQNLAEACRKSRQLYFHIIKSIPSALERFNLPYTPAEVRAVVKAEFMKNAGISDPAVIDYLNFRGRLELEEVNQMWKQKPHLVKFLTQAQTLSSRVSDQDRIEGILTGKI